MTRPVSGSTWTAAKAARCWLREDGLQIPMDESLVHAWSQERFVWGEKRSNGESKARYGEPDELG
jgi:hypothetical protein